MISPPTFSKSTSTPSGHAEVVHHEVHAVDSQLAQHVVEEAGIAVHAVREVARLVRASEARHVGRDRPRELAGLPQEVGPILPGTGIAVDEDHGLARVSRSRLEDR